MSDWKVEYWIDAENIRDVSYSAYWNDEENERSKEFNVLDGNFDKMERYIDDIGLYKDLEMCVDSLGKNFNIMLEGLGIDLGAGNLWMASKLLSSGRWNITKLYCLEYSKHRLLKIGPKVLEYYGVSPDKVVLVLGSFYELKLKSGSVNFILLSMAFHHADDPDRLLFEIRRVLKPRGVVIIIGEHFSSLPLCAKNIFNICFKHEIKFFITKFITLELQQKLFHKTFNTQTFLPKLRTFFPHDPVLGDHMYTQREYKDMFIRHGFTFRLFKRPDSKYCCYVLVLN